MGREQILGSAPATTLAGAINNSVTAFSITSGTGWPTGSPGPFVATIDRGTATEEKILVGSRSGTSLSSVTRGYDGSTAQSHLNLAIIEHTISAAMLDEANRIVNEQTGVAVYAAGTTAAQSSKVTGEGNPRWTRDASGKMTWGPGSGAVDVQLARLAADQLELQDEFRVTRGAGANLAHSVRVTADTQDRLNIDATGKHLWGSGSGAGDTNLYRLSADKLKTDDAFEVGAAFTALSTADVTGLFTAANYRRGSGSPEGAVTAGVGSIYERTDGGAGTSLYVKESGAGNTGWKAKGGSLIAHGEASVAVNTTVAETDLANISIPGGTLVAGDALRFLFYGDYLANGVASDFTFRFRWGTTIVFGSTANVTTASNALRHTWLCEVLLQAVSGTVQRAVGTMLVSSTSGANDWMYDGVRQGIASSIAGGETLSGAVTARMTVQPTVSSPNGEGRLLGYIVEKVAA